MTRGSCPRHCTSRGCQGRWRLLLLHHRLQEGGPLPAGTGPSQPAGHGVHVVRIERRQGNVWLAGMHNPMLIAGGAGRGRGIVESRGRSSALFMSVPPQQIESGWRAPKILPRPPPWGTEGPQRGQWLWITSGTDTCSSQQLCTVTVDCTGSSPVSELHAIALAPVLGVLDASAARRGPPAVCIHPRHAANHAKVPGDHPKEPHGDGGAKPPAGCGR